jgi:putative flippase GtrA
LRLRIREAWKLLQSQPVYAGILASNDKEVVNFSVPGYCLFEFKARQDSLIFRFVLPFAVRLDAKRLQFVKFVIAAGMSVPVNLASRVFFSMFVAFELAIILSQICGMAVAYLLIKRFVFKNSGRKIQSELFRFTLVNLISLAQVWLVAVGLLKFVLPKFDMISHPELVSHFIGLMSSAPTAFIGHKTLSFGPGKHQSSGFRLAAILSQTRGSRVWNATLEAQVLSAAPLRIEPCPDVTVPCSRTHAVSEPIA